MIGLPYAVLLILKIQLQTINTTNMSRHVLIEASWVYESVSRSLECRLRYALLSETNAFVFMF